MEKVRLNDWWMNNQPDEKLIYRNGLYDQCIFIRDRIMTELFLHICTDIDKYRSFSIQWDKIYDTFHPFVISKHTSKSVRLPVFELDLDRIRLKIILRNNFYDWCISIESEKEIVIDWMGLVNPKDKGYFEGFPKDRIYEPYYADRNNKNFSVVLRNDYEVYTFMVILRNWAINKYNLKKGE